MANVRRFMKKYGVRQFMAYFLVCQMLFGLPAQMVRAATPIVGSYDPSTAGISQTTNTTTVNLLAEQAIINWDNFNTDPGELFEFLRNNGISPFAVLNKVSGGATLFEGNLEAIKGTVFILNPDGITFAPTAFITARNLVASSMKMKDSDFLNATAGGTISGDMEFTNPSSYEGARLVANYGTITNADSIYLVGKNVLNAGTITANAGGLVAMVAGDEMILGKPGSDVIVKKLIVNHIENHTVDNGAIGGTASNLNSQFGINASGNTGSVSAPGGDLVLAAGDIWSNAIDNVQDLSATAHGDIHLEEAINITGDMRAEAGQPTEYGSDWVVTDGGLGWTDYEEQPVTVEHGGDIHAKDTITAGGNIDIIANDVQLDGDAEATTGDLKIAGRQSGGPDGGWGDVETAGLTAGGDIEVSVTGMDREWSLDGWDTTWLFWTFNWNYGSWKESTPVPGEITLNGDAIAGGNLTLFNNTWTAPDVTLQAGVDIILENGEAFYQNCDTLTGDTKLTLDAKTGQIDQGTATISVTGSELIMRQAPTLNLAGRSFDLQDTTHLTLESYNGSVFATDEDTAACKPFDGDDENAADQWASIGAKANGGIILSGHENDIKARRLEAAHGPIEVDAKTNDILANAHGFIGDDGILASGGGNITLTGKSVKVVGDIDAHHGSGIRPVGYNSDLTIDATDDIELDGYANIDGDMELRADDDVTAKGNLIAGGSIDIYSSDTTTTLGGDLIEAADDITLHNNTVLDGGALQKVKALTGQLYTNGSVHKTTTGNLEMFGGYNGPLYPDMDYSVKTQDVTVDDGELSIAGNATVKLEGSIYSKGKMTLASNADGIPSTPSQATPSSSPYSYDQLIHSSGTIQSLNGDVDLSAQNSTISLNGGSNPTDAYVSAGGDILIRNYTWVQYDRKLQAGDDIVLAAGKRLQGMGSLSLIAGDDIIIGSTDVDYHWLDPEDDTGSPSVVKTNTGDLILNAGDSVYVHGELITLDGSGGDIEITASDDTIHLYGNVTADQTDGGDIILHANTEIADGVTLDAGDDVEAFGTVTGGGDLTINAGTIESGSASDYANIRLHQTVTVEGSLVMTAGDDIEAADTLMATGTNGAGNMILNAGDDIDLDGTAASAQSAGLMELIADLDPSNGTGNVDVAGSLEGNMKLSGTNVYVDGTVTSHGTLDVDADDDVELRANVSSVGEMTIDAGSDIELNRSSGDTSSESTITLDAGDDVTIGKPFSGEGNVTANGKMDIFAGSDSDDSVKVFGKLTTTNGGNIHVTAGDDIILYGTFNGPDFESAQADGDLTLDAEDDVDVLGDLISNNGSIDIYSSDDTTYLGGDVYAAYDVTLHNNTILDGGDNQTLEAGIFGYGTMTAGGWVWKTTPGNLYLLGNNDEPEHNNGKAIDLQYAGCLPAASTALGNLELYAEKGDIQISGDLTTFGLSDDGPECGEWYDRPTGGVSVIAENGKIYTDADSPDPAAGDYMLNIGISGNSDHYQCLGVDLPWLDEGEEGKAAIVVLSREDLIFGPDTMLIARGNYYDAGGLNIWDFIDFTGVESYGDYFDIFDEFFGQIGGCIADHKAFCSAVWEFVGDLEEDGFDFGDLGAFKDLFTDFVDEYFEDLLIVDDRPGVGFLADPLTAIGGIIRDEGDPIDVAVYAGSMGTEEGQGNVHLDGSAIDVADAGTMVVDAYDTVTFGDFDTSNLENFEGCEDLGCFFIKLAMRFHDENLCEAFGEYVELNGWYEGVLEDFLNDSYDEGFFFNIDRLEVVSRVTEWLFEASTYGTLPYPYNPEIVEAFIGGDYILRGAGLGNPLITDGRAWVLEDPISPPPLFREAGEASEEEAFGEGGCPALMNWLAVEIGVPADEIQVVVEGAFALSTDIQPCEMCARLLAASNTLQDPDGTQIAAMIQVLNELVTTPAPPSPEQMTSIAAAFAEHVDDGTSYASAGQWIDALVAYVSILNTEMGYSATDAVALADKYLTPVTEAGNATLTAYVQARLAALGG